MMCGQINLSAVGFFWKLAHPAAQKEALLSFPEYLWVPYV